MTKRFKGWAMVFAAAVMSSSVADAQDSGTGQDIGTGTPPELRDFRLDTPPPRPAPQQSAPDPAVTAPPPAESTSTPSTPRAEQRPTASRPAAALSNRTSDTPSGSEATADVVASPATVAADDPANAAENPIAATGVDTDAPLASTSVDAQPLLATPPWLWPVAGGLLAILAAAAWFFFRRKRRTSAAEPAAFPEPVPQPSPPARLDTPRPAGPPAAPRTTLRPEESSAPVVAQFTPTSAQLSIASLSITGILEINNLTPMPVSGLILRSHMISAQDGQREAVAAFHSDRGAGSIQPLGDLSAGERIEATIEIRLPRNELSSFRWTEREFVAPIVLIHLSGSADSKPLEIQITQLIGREGANQSDRMQPLPIDRGPKRFSGIAARPVFA